MPKPGSSGGVLSPPSDVPNSQRCSTRMTLCHPDDVVPQLGKPEQTLLGAARTRMAYARSWNARANPGGARVLGLRFWVIRSVPQRRGRFASSSSNRKSRRLCNRWWTKRAHDSAIAKLKPMYCRSFWLSEGVFCAAAIPSACAYLKISSCVPVLRRIATPSTDCQTSNQSPEFAM